MNGFKVEGFGCLAVFAAIGFIAAIILVIAGLIWMYNHVSIN
jgi:hypothetical protein